MRIKFTPAYPFEAPAIMMLTPNGRFAENQSVCTTDSLQESWNPAERAGAYDLAFILYDDERTHERWGADH